MFGNVIDAEKGLTAPTSFTKMLSNKLLPIVAAGMKHFYFTCEWKIHWKSVQWRAMPEFCVMESSRMTFPG